VDERAETTKAVGDAMYSVLSRYLWLSRVNAPDLCFDELDEKRVAARSFDHHRESVIADAPPAFDNRLSDRPLDVLTPNSTEVVAVRPPKKREHLVIQYVADRGTQSGGNEGEPSFFSEGVLHHRGELAKFAYLVLMDLIERDEEAGLVLCKQVRE
jgi:hypothetical protein